MRLTAHRGFAGRYPENTLFALRRAAARADMVEFDVRRCGSSELVVVHDETVDRVTDATGRVAEFSAAELAALSVLDSGEGIPTLESVLDALPPEAGVNVELKERGLETDALTAVSDIESEVVVSSFDADVLRTVRAADSGIALAYTLDVGHEDAIDTALSLDCGFVHPHESLCFTTDIVGDAHDAGMEVNAWTVESRTVADALSRRGVDGVIADSPDVL